MLDSTSGEIMTKTVHEINISEYELTGKQSAIDEYKVRLELVYTKDGEDKTKNSVVKWPKILDDLTLEQRERLILDQTIAAERMIEGIDD